MTQIGTVTALPAPGTAVVTVARQTACGHACEQCAGCGAQAGSVTVRASAPLPLEVGDRVELYSGNRVLAVAALVYLGPAVLFLAGYLLTAGLAEGWRYIWGGAGFALGLGAAAVCDRRLRRKNTLRYQVLRRL